MGNGVDSISEEETTFEPDPKAGVLRMLFFAGFFALWAGIAGGLLYGFAVDVLISADPLDASWIDVAVVVALGVFVWRMAVSYLRLDSTQYTVSANGVESTSGVLSTNVTSVAFEDVTDVHYNQTAVEGVFGVGTVALNTAGSDTAELAIRHVSGARELYERIDRHTAA